jgi:hypothetical protein
LSHRLEVLPVEFGPRRSWSVTVVTKCRGWRRHRHAAKVIDAGRHLQFGPFLLCRSLVAVGGESHGGNPHPPR